VHAPRSAPLAETPLRAGEPQASRGARPGWPPSLEEQLQRLGEEAYPEEACGLLIGPVDADGTGPFRRPRTLPGANVSTGDRRDSFRVSPRWVKEVDGQLQQSDEVITGFYHSHPDAPCEPSAADSAGAMPGYVYVIVSVLSGLAVAGATFTREGPDDPLARIASGWRTIPSSSPRTSRFDGRWP